MVRAFKTAVAWLVLAGSAMPAVGSDCGSLASLEWLLGEWVADGANATFRESWAARGPQTWEGRGVETSKADPTKVSTEVLRLVEMSGGVFYFSKVAHNELPVAFRLSECANGRFAFVNPAHDFPKRLDYERDGADRLQVRVSDGANQGFTLDFARAPLPSAGLDPVLAAEDARFAAMVAAETSSMRRWFAEDLVYVHSTGVTEGREQLIEGIAAGKLKYLAIEPVERRVVSHGTDAAFVQGIARIKARLGAQDLDFRARYLAIYSLNEGTWQLRAWQSLRLP